jgi:hypothetical protein
MPRLPLYQRILFKIPVLGWMLKDVMHGEDDNIYYFLLALVSLWGIAILQFGLLGLMIPALLLVPVVFVTLIVITRG